MQPLPNELVDAFDANPDEDAAWDVLADWVQEHHAEALAAPWPSAPEDVRFQALSRRDLPQAGFLRWEGERGPALYGLEPLLKGPRVCLLTELRIEANWPGSHAMYFGMGPAVAQPPQDAILPAVLTAALASAPPLLRRLQVWIPANPRWRPQDDCLTQLAPLLRQRPRLARQLTLRAPRKGLVPLLRRLAVNGWRTLSVRSAFTPADLVDLETIALDAPQVTFELYGERFDARVPNLVWAPDPDEFDVTLDELRLRLLPGRGAPHELEVALHALDLQLTTQLGVNTLGRRSPPMREATLTINGHPFSGLTRLRVGGPLLVELTRIEPPLRVAHRLELHPTNQR